MEPKDKTIKVLVFNEWIEMNEKDFENFIKAEKVLDAKRCGWYNPDPEGSIQPFVEKSARNWQSFDDLDSGYIVNAQGWLEPSIVTFFVKKKVSKAQRLKDSIRKLLGSIY
jgi:hypothetical protein